MSNFIPMLSASPPPLDEGPSFEDDWGDGGDFGGFQSAVGAAGENTENQFNTSNGEAGAGFRPIVTESGAGGAKSCEWQGSCSSKVTHSNSNLSVHSALTEGPSSTQSSMHISNHSSGHDSAIFSDEFQDDSKPVHDLKPLENNKLHKVDTQDNTSQESVTDSGLCSDISPVPKSEEYSDFVECKPDAEGEDIMFRSAEDVMFQSADSAKAETTSLRDSGNEGPEEEEYEGVRHRVLSGDDPLDLKTSSITGEEEEEAEAEEDEYRDETFGQFSPSEMGYSLPDNFSKYQSEEPFSGASDSPSSPPESSEDEDEERDSASPLEEFSTEDSSHTDTLNDKCGHDEGNEDESSELSMVGMDPTWAVDSQDTQSHIKHEFSSGQLPPEEDFADFQSVPALAAPPTQPPPPDPAAQSPPCDSEAQNEGSGDWLQDCMSDEEFTDIRTSEPASVPAGAGGEVEEGEEESDDEEFSGFMEAAPLDSGLAQQADTSTSNPEDDEEEEDDDDDDDDWAFKDAEDHDEDDFGNFAEPCDTNSGGFADFGEPVEEGGDDDWAAFAEAEPAAAPPADEAVEDDDFADFEEVKPQQPAGVLSALKGVDGSNRLVTLLSNCFPATDINGNHCELNTLLDLLTQEVRREQEPPPKQPGRGSSSHKSRVIDVNVWNNLKDLENTAALQYSWKTSTNNTHLLKALTIDTRNILMGHKKQAVPIFASGLGLLEPSRGPADPAGKKDPPPSDLPLAPTNVPEAIHHQPPPTPQDIPPAEFDWTSSGLTNPLDSLENELLHAIAPPQSSQPKALQPLETILANMKFTPTALPTHKEEKLSLEAGRVIGNFQDLAFLRAKYLVFPIKGDTE